MRLSVRLLLLRGRRKILLTSLRSHLTGGEFPLYLHRYVCDNSFDPAEAGYDPATRGVQIDNNSFKNKTEYNKFKVEAFFTDNNSGSPSDKLPYISRTTASELDNGRWKPGSDKAYYWPGKEQLTFYAWAPNDIPAANLSIISTTNKEISFTYKAQKSENGTDDAKAQKDILMAIKSCNKSSSQSGVVPLEFTHALSAIKFAVRDGLEGCTVTGVSIENVYSSGSCIYSLDSDDYYDQDGQTIQKTGKYTWTVDDTKGLETYSQSFDKVISESDEDVYITNSEQETTFMLMPQTLPENASIALSVKFTIKNEDGTTTEKDVTLRGKFSDFAVVSSPNTGNSSEIEEDNESTNQKITEWRAGKEYVYVISTSLINWTYVFDVVGSYQEEYVDDWVTDLSSKTKAPGANPILKDSRDALEVNFSYYNTADDREPYENLSKAYYKVLSYRYKTNDPKTKEAVPWTVNYTDGTSEVQDQFKNNQLLSDYSEQIEALSTPLSSANWILTTEAAKGGDYWTPATSPVSRSSNAVGTSAGGGPGSTDISEGNNFGYLQYDISFASQYIATDYPGDWWLRQDSRVKKNSKDNAFDLSTPEGTGVPQNTANCYIVNAGGWYKLPLVYGNAITNGVTNDKAYTYNDQAKPIIYNYLDLSGDRALKNRKVSYEDMDYDEALRKYPGINKNQDIVADSEMKNYVNNDAIDQKESPDVTPANVSNCIGYTYLKRLGDDWIENGTRKVKVITTEDKWDVERHYPLKHFTDYKGEQITGPWITPTAKDAILVWEDSKGTIKDVNLDASNKYLVFRVDNSNLQQANAIVAVRDADRKIMWSWHIWVTDCAHWANSNVPKRNRKSLEDYPDDVLHLCNVWMPEENNAPVTSFNIAPVNLGWCDKKNVGYLKRTGKFYFAQDYSNIQNKEEIPAENQQKKRSLAVKQRGHIVNYWIGNNTYYQYGRKDPLPGFINTYSRNKETFGPHPYNGNMRGGINFTEPIQVCIREPYSFPQLHVNTRNIYNLWNNYYDPNQERVTYIPGYGTSTSSYTTTNIMQDGGSYNPLLSNNYTYSAVKTVYDPSPPGFVIPPYKFFDSFTKGRNQWQTHEDNAQMSDFNGTCRIITDPDNYTGDNMYYSFKGNNAAGVPSVYFAVNGQRYIATWQWSSQLVYLSSNTLVLRWKQLYSMVLGVENVKFNFLITSVFRGGTEFGRPIRCVKEYMPDGEFPSTGSGL